MTEMLRSLFGRMLTLAAAALLIAPVLAAEPKGGPEPFKNLKFRSVGPAAGGLVNATLGLILKIITFPLTERRIPRDEEIVICVTGNGLKTIDAVSQEYTLTPAIEPRLSVFETFINDRMVAVAGN